VGANRHDAECTNDEAGGACYDIHDVSPLEAAARTQLFAIAFPQALIAGRVRRIIFPGCHPSRGGR
jgi:hypothetical protein